jgi:hypothetical protein
MTNSVRVAGVMETPKGNVSIFSTDGLNATLHAPFAAPPGSPLTGTLSGTNHILRVKVHGCRRLSAESDSTLAGSSVSRYQFEITGRWVNLSRDARLVLVGETLPQS